MFVERVNRISFAGVLKVILDFIFAVGIVWMAFSLVVLIVVNDAQRILHFDWLKRIF